MDARHTAVAESPATERARLTLDLSHRLNADLERLASENGMSKSEVLRFGLELLAAAHKAKREGLNVGAWKDDPATGTRLEREFVGNY